MPAREIVAFSTLFDRASGWYRSSSAQASFASITDEIEWRVRERVRKALPPSDL